MEISFVVHVHMYANLRALMTQKLCAVGMHNAILRNHLKYKSFSKLKLTTTNQSH